VVPLLRSDEEDRVASLVLMRGSRTSLVALVLVLLAPPIPAAAQNEGVFVDPDSPTGKQYQVPLESARRQADPRGDGRVAPPGGRPTGTSAAPLFGEGIVTSQRGKGSSNGDPANTSDSRRKDKRQVSPSSPSSGSPGARGAVQAAVSNPGAPSGGVGSTLLIAAGGAIVLLAGGLAGVLMRRRSPD
jgi:hypothetical protein